MLRTILGIPFVLVGYILMIPGSLFAWVACKIRGKDYPGLTTSKLINGNSHSNTNI